MSKEEQDKLDKIQSVIIESAMYLTLLIGWLKGKGLWDECVKSLNIPPNAGDIKK